MTDVRPNLGTKGRLGGAPWLTQGPLPRLLAILDRDGEEARAVGGAVRNALLGEPVGEVDVATTAHPDEVVRRAGRAGFKAVPTGIDHGTVTVIVGGKPFEVTALREDVETFGRKAKVRFGRDWKRDAERRDFTINALSVSRDGAVHDYVGGLADLKARRVRFIGDAESRIREDYLRILRFFRFHAWYGNGYPDGEGLHAAILLRDGLDRLSRERVRTELMKTLVAPQAVATFGAMADAGLLLRVLAGVPLLASFAMMVRLEAARGLEADAVRRLAALGCWLPEDAERLTGRLRLSNSERDRLSSMADAWWRIDPARGEPAARALLYGVGPDRYCERILIAWSRSRAGTADQAWHDLATLQGRWTPPASPFRAAAFMSRGIVKGPALGASLAAAEAAWVAADFPTDAAALAAIADRVIAAVPR